MRREQVSLHFAVGPGCWLWMGRRAPSGHGRLCVGGLECTAHRYMYQVEHGYRATHGLVVHHTCEVKLCVNPAHLKAMTRSEHSKLHARLRAEQVSR